MVVVYRAHGLRFVIFVDDHEPAHVHIFGDGELKVTIRGENGLPEIAYNLGMKTNDRRRAMDVMLAEQDIFMARWHEIQGDRR